MADYFHIKLINSHNSLSLILRPSEDPVSIVVMRSLTEALPENRYWFLWKTIVLHIVLISGLTLKGLYFILSSRLSRLLHKHKFTEAENFAIQFGLDVEVSCSFMINTFEIKEYNWNYLWVRFLPYNPIESITNITKAVECYLIKQLTIIVSFFTACIQSKSKHYFREIGFSFSWELWPGSFAGSWQWSQRKFAKNSGLFLFLPSFPTKAIQIMKDHGINFSCFLVHTGQPVCCELLHKCSLATVWNHSRNAELC